MGTYSDNLSSNVYIFKITSSHKTILNYTISYVAMMTLPPSITGGQLVILYLTLPCCHDDFADAYNWWTVGYIYILRCLAAMVTLPTPITGGQLVIYIYYVALLS